MHDRDKLRRDGRSPGTTKRPGWRVYLLEAGLGEEGGGARRQGRAFSELPPLRWAVLATACDWSPVEALLDNQLRRDGLPQRNDGYKTGHRHLNHGSSYPTGLQCLAERAVVAVVSGSLLIMAVPALLRQFDAKRVRYFAGMHHRHPSERKQQPEDLLPQPQLIKGRKHRQIVQALFERRPVCPVCRGDRCHTYSE